LSAYKAKFSRTCGAFYRETHFEVKEIAEERGLPRLLLEGVLDDEFTAPPPKWIARENWQ
jgi:hypothetical protein